MDGPKKKAQVLPGQSASVVHVTFDTFTQR